LNKYKKNIAQEHLARTDKLTELYNQVKSDETLISESHRANRFPIILEQF